MAREKWLVDGPRTIDLDRVRALKVGLIAGQVDIVAHDEPGARVEVHSVTGKALKITIDDGTLEIDHPQLGWDNFLDVFTYFNGEASADVSIMVPRDVALKFGVVSANALISGLQPDSAGGAAKISTVNGEVVVDRLIGDLELNAVNGELSVRDHTGNVTARTVNGEVTLTGDIARLTCDSVSGDVYLDLTGTPDQVRVNTVSGSVTARLAAGVAVEYRITTASGRLQLDESEITGVHGSYTGKYGDLSGRWLEFRANTVTGDVSVLHAKETA